MELDVNSISNIKSNKFIDKTFIIKVIGTYCADINAEIVLDDDVYLDFSECEEFTCNSIYIKECSVKIENLKLIGSIKITDGVLAISGSHIHNPLPGTDYVVSISKSSGMESMECVFSQSSKYGIIVEDNSVLNFLKSHIYDIEYDAITVTYFSSFLMHSSIIEKAKMNGLMVYHSSKAVIGSSQISLIGKNSISIIDSKFLKIDSSVIKDSSFGISIKHCTDCFITDCTFSNLDHNCVLMINSIGLIKRSLFQHCNGNCLNIFSKSKIIISKSDFQDSSFSPISIIDNSIALVKKCGIKRSKMCGIIIRNESDCNIEDSTIENIQHFGVSTSDESKVNIRNTLFIECKYSCVGCYNHSYLSLDSCYQVGPGEYGNVVFTGGNIVSLQTTTIGMSKCVVFIHHAGSASIQSPLIGLEAIDTKDDIISSIKKIDLHKTCHNVEKDQLFQIKSLRPFTISSGYVIGFGIINVNINKDIELPCSGIHSTSPSCSICGTLIGLLYFSPCSHVLYCKDCWYQLEKKPESCELCLFPIFKAIPMIDCSIENGICPICCEMPYDTIILPCGHIICKTCANKCFIDSDDCPYCREPNSRGKIFVSYK